MCPQPWAVVCGIYARFTVMVGHLIFCVDDFVYEFLCYMLDVLLAKRAGI